ncbi:hypothetical protein G3I60_37700 [Streptomyces sp. SID13666]|uniref:hypothetical protein n=1 Tax=unclassified Streptomyces TaxID=2593676 RepID=UPI0013BF9CDC|nr:MULTISPECIES: hypothetical protein [unclassified Streptomyces]NEA59746.1 hypothetical protein [Streptomyces sp. SID13666]NEA76706.1 hypothetical protein [Streptomyces sp. SID13588]
MPSLPIPCPAHLIPDATGLDTFNTAYQAATMADAVYVGVERRSRRWAVKADTLTAAPGHVIDDCAHEAVRCAAIRLVRSGEISSTSGPRPGPGYYTLNGLPSQDRARELAAALHAALYGDLEPLARAVPTTLSS